MPDQASLAVTPEREEGVARATGSNADTTSPPLYDFAYALTPLVRFPGARHRLTWLTTFTTYFEVDGVPVEESIIDHSQLEVRLGNVDNPTSAMGTVLNRESITEEDRAKMGLSLAEA